MRLRFDPQEPLSEDWKIDFSAIERVAHSRDFNPAAVECDICAVHDNVKPFPVMTVRVECNCTLNQPS